MDILKDGRLELSNNRAERAVKKDRHGTQELANSISAKAMVIIIKTTKQKAWTFYDDRSTDSVCVNVELMYMTCKGCSTILI